MTKRASRQAAPLGELGKRSCFWVICSGRFRVDRGRRGFFSVDGRRDDGFWSRLTREMWRAFEFLFRGAGAGGDFDAGVFQKLAALAYLQDQDLVAGFEAGTDLGVGFV